jgi:hypothetical protein
MVTALGMDAVLRSLAPAWFGPNGRVDSVPVLLFALFYGLLFSVLGGYVTALIAKRQELQHAFILGLLQFAMGLIATVKFYDTAPLWFHVSFLVLLIPANVFGGQLRMAQKRKLRRGSLAAV